MSAVDRVLLLIKKYIMEDTRSITVYKRLKQQITESNESKKRRTIAKLNVQRTKTKTKQKIPTGIKIILIRTVSWEYNNVDVLPLRRKPLLTKERGKLHPGQRVRAMVSFLPSLPERSHVYTLWKC